MEDTPLASLSLTHVHYNPRRPNILPLRLARSRPPSSLCDLRDPNMVDARDRDPPHVCGANRMRGAELLA
ncbi:hypothetical protein ABVK25_010973 [Lepraria finkii]|uniref:Uncharacterized protein n=1 Tax=Lepraria finkii TaxID=1340010 RepID=A0ABR4AT87_9LECA